MLEYDLRTLSVNPRSASGASPMLNSSSWFARYRNELLTGARGRCSLPSKLDRMGPVGTEALDRDDLVLLRIGQSHQTRAYRLTVEMDGASAASADTATKFG